MSPSTAYAMSAYRRASTALPPIDATVKICDEIINALMRADLALGEKKFREAHAETQKAVTFCRGMQVALNHDAGADVAATLDKYYNTFILSALHTIGQPNARLRYHRLLVGMLRLRNAWAENGGLPLRQAPPEPEEG